MTESAQKNRRLRWVGWLVLLCGLAVGVMAFDRFVPAMRQALREPEMRGLDERLTDVRPASAPWLLDHTGGRWGRNGWYLGAGEAGQVRIHLPGSEDGVLTLRLWAYSPGRLSVQLSDRSKTHDIPPSYLDSRILTYAVKGPAKLVLSASNELSDEQLVLDRFAASWKKAEDRLPPIWPLGSALAICLAGFLLIHGTHAQHISWSLWFGAYLICAATIAGFAQRWDLLDLARGLPPDPDTAAYMVYAQSLEWWTPDHGFYSGNFMEREPAHVAALREWFRLWGMTAPSAKFYTVCLSVFLIPVCGTWIWALSGQWVLGGLAAWVIALSPAWIDESVRGLRLESLTLMLIAILSLWLWARGWIGAFLLGLATGVMALIQSPFLSVILPLVWLGWLANLWRRRQRLVVLAPGYWQARYLVLASFLAILLYVPHLYGLYKVHGDPAWPSYRYARWNANVEFPERLGTTGFPSAEEFQRNSYAGPPITYAQYLFGLHSIPQLLFGQIKGWVESTAYMSASVTPHLKELIFLYHASGLRAVLRHLRPDTVLVFLLTLGLTILGFLELGRDPRYWWVPVLSLWGTWYVAYLYSVRLVEPFRHTGHVYPLLLFCLLWGGYRVCLFLANRFGFAELGLSALSMTAGERTRVIR